MEISKKCVRCVNLKAFRLENELSQKDIADYLEVSISFISSIERGQSPLPLEKLVRLLDNEQGWETDSLLDNNKDRTIIHQDYRTISGNIEGEFHAPVHNNNYNGFSDEEFEKELARRTALKDQQIASLEAEVERLRRDLDRERALLADEKTTNSRLMGILEKGEFRKARK